MTLQEAKVFFISYGCSHFHMDREEPLKSRDYADLGIPHQLEDEWRRESIEETRVRLWEKPEVIWSLHNSIVRLMHGLQSCTDRDLDILLSIMQGMEKLDIFQRTLILENMAGRTAKQTDGGIALFKNRCTFYDQVKDSIWLISGNERSEDERFLKAAKACHQAERLFLI